MALLSSWMFWLRFFGGSRVRDNNATSALTSTTQTTTSTKLKPFDSCLFNLPDATDSSQEDNVIKSRGSRRSAIDLSTRTYSLDIGPHTVYRWSFDYTFANSSLELTSILKGFTNFRTLHRGSHARLLKAEKKFSDESVVFKLYDKSNLNSSQLEDISKEVDILRKAKIYGTAELLDVFEDDRLILLYLKEYANGSLMACIDDHGGTLSEELCIKYVVEPMLDILCKLHKDGYVHRDIKPEHILYDDEYRAYLCDFYVTGIVGRDNFTDREGTLSYMAPEMLARPTPEEIFHIVLSRGVDEADLPSYNEKVDIWSLGVAIVEALTGMLPFVSDTPEGMMAVHARHFSGEQCSAPLRQLETSGQISEDALDFLSKIFQMDPNDRADAQSLLYHPWLHTVY